MQFLHTFYWPFCHSSPTPLKCLDLDLQARKARENIKLLPVNIFRVLLRYIITKKRKISNDLVFTQWQLHFKFFLDVLIPLCNYINILFTLARLVSRFPRKKVLWRHRKLLTRHNRDDLACAVMSVRRKSVQTSRRQKVIMTSKLAFVG